MASSIQSSTVTKIILACEAGMGSSLMSVNSLKKKFKAAKLDKVQIVHSPVRALPKDATLVIVHKGLGNTARSIAPQAVVVTFSHFISDPIFDKLVQAFVEGKEIQASEG
jgi:galactose PTS system EIIB component